MTVTLDQWDMVSEDFTPLIEEWEDGDVEVIGDPRGNVLPVAFVLTRSLTDSEKALAEIQAVCEKYAVGRTTPVLK